MIKVQFFNTRNGSIGDYDYVSASQGMYLGLFAGWTPYYNRDGIYVGYKCCNCGTGYSTPDGRYTTYEGLDW